MTMSMRKVLLIAVGTVVGVVLLASACVAALSDGQSQPAGSAPVSQVPPTVEVAQEPTESPSVAESQVSVTRAGNTMNDNEVYVLSEPMRLQRGTLGNDRYLCSMVTMENKSSDVVSYNIFYWKLKDPEGFESNFDVFGSDRMLGSGDLTPGDKVKGDVCFQFGGTAGEYTLSLDSTWGTGPEMQWKHQVS